MSNTGDIKLSKASKPFVVSAVVLVFAGSVIGSIWMMSLLGVNLPYLRDIFPLHKVFQVDGFLTLLIMGIGYMIVPRFRNASIPSTKLAYLSLLLVLFSIATSMISTVDNVSSVLLGTIAKLSGVSIFAAMLFWMLRIKPRLLRMADYFIMLSIITLLVSDLLQLLGHITSNPLTEVQLWLLFPVMMIFGVEYKTLPSFLGFIRPAKKLSVVSLGLAVASVIVAILSTIIGSLALSVIFNIMLLGCAITFASSVYIFGGFDYSEILQLIQGEKKARYMYTLLHSRLAFIFLYAGITIAIAFGSVANNYAFYDLAIHYTAIGFIGITIALYMPLMLPPITGRIIHFSKFNRMPILLVVAALSIRTIGDTVITAQWSSYANYFLMTSGWIIVSALFVFVIMIHKSMREIDPQLKGNPSS